MKDENLTCLLPITKLRDRKKYIKLTKKKHYYCKIKDKLKLIKII